MLYSYFHTQCRNLLSKTKTNAITDMQEGKQDLHLKVKLLLNCFGYIFTSQAIDQHADNQSKRTKRHFVYCLVYTDAIAIERDFVYCLVYTDAIVIEDYMG